MYDGLQMKSEDLGGNQVQSYYDETDQHTLHFKFKVALKALCHDISGDCYYF